MSSKSSKICINIELFNKLEILLSKLIKYTEKKNRYSHSRYITLLQIAMEYEKSLYDEEQKNYKNIKKK